MNETLFHATFEAKYNGQKIESAGDPDLNVLVTSINFIKNTH